MVRKYAERHPAILMLAFTYAWSWLFFFLAFASWHGSADLRLALFVLGAFGPAVGGVLTLRLQPSEVGPTQSRLSAFVVGAALAAAALVLLRINFLGVASLQGSWLLDIQERISVHAFAAYLLPILVSGWIFSSAGSRHASLRQHFSGLVPGGSAILLTVPLLFFLPALFIGSNFLATFLGIDYPDPRYKTEVWTAWLPLMLVKLFTVALLTGGNEEHGWRGVLLPILQRKFSPLVAAFVIAIVWELWHLPVVLSGLYGDGSAMAIVGGRLILTLPVTVLITALYNFSRGSIFLCVVFHACLNTQISFFVGSSLAIPLALVVAALLIIGLAMWQRGTGYDPLKVHSGCQKLHTQKIC